MHEVLTEFAPLLNTLGIAVLGVILNRHKKGLEEVKRGLDTAQQLVALATESAASAATASSDVARIVKELGGLARRVEPPVVIPPEHPR